MSAAHRLCAHIAVLAYHAVMCAPHRVSQPHSASLARPTLVRQVDLLKCYELSRWSRHITVENNAVSHGFASVHYDEAVLLVVLQYPVSSRVLLPESIKGRVSALVDSLHDRISQYGGLCKVANHSHTRRFVGRHEHLLSER